MVQPIDEKITQALTAIHDNNRATRNTVMFLMDLTSDLWKLSNREGDYELAQGFSLVESWINNKHHGKPAQQWLTELHTLMSDRSLLSDSDRQAVDALIPVVEALLTKATETL